MSDPLYPCATCGGTCTKRGKICMSCYLKSVQRPRACSVCGKRKPKSAATRCRACYLRAVADAPKARKVKTCADCGGQRTQGRVRCQPCSQVYLAHLTRTPEHREKMRAAALRRHARVRGAVNA